MGFAELGLRDEILRAVAEVGYTEPTPVQAQAIPVVLTGRDLCAIAQTGTGKTAGFTLPMIHHLAAGRARARMPRSLIISPTRELATQTAENFDLYGRHLKLNKALLIGGTALGEQEKILERGVDVLIATPGRLLDQFERGNVLLNGIEILVIDEADRMLDMGFIPDVERIASLIIRPHQTLLFSATMPKEVRKLADKFLTDPETIEVSRPATTGVNIDDKLIEIGERQKLAGLKRLIKAEGIDKAIIFCNRKRSVAALKRQLGKDGFNVSDIHGDLDQSERNATLDAFKRNELDLLVATDVAARGLDISALPFVINYDVPTNPDDYVHRIGRTGRAGAKGRAFTFATPSEEKFVLGIAKHLGREIPKVPAEEAIPVSKRGGKAEETIPATKRGGKAEDVAPAERDVPEEAAPAPRRGRKARTPAPETVEPAKAGEETAPAGKAEAPAEKAKSARKGRKTVERDEPVVGFGDQTPSFLLRRVPLPQRGGSDADKQAA